MKSVYKNLVTFPDAVGKAFANIKRAGGDEIVDVKDSTGRILSENVFSPRNNPPFHRATMDGYAVRSGELVDADEDRPAKITVSGESYIGEPRKQLPEENSCFRISTGAIVPAGADAVVKVESTTEKDDRVSIRQSVKPGENIAESGSDVASSELLMLAGKEIETSDIAVLASLGISTVKVLRKLRIRVLSTGNELIHYSEPYQEGRINDANGIALVSELNSYATFEAIYSGIVRDNYSEMVDRVEKEINDCDVLILSGGSSAGESDLVYRIIEEMQPGLIFHGVLVKPGLPTVLGRSGEKVVIGLPGFPVSALMVFRSIFLVPLLRASGSRRTPSVVNGVLGTKLRLDLGRQNLVPVRVSDREGSRIYPVTGLSGSISRFTGTSGFVSVEGNTRYVEAGTSLPVTEWTSRPEPRESVLSGMFFEDVHSPLREFSEETEFLRMLPRDSIRSLVNGDADVSAFLVTVDMLPLKQRMGEIAGDEFSVLTGTPADIVLASRRKIGDMEEASSLVNNGVSLAGPSLRFLSNVVTGNESLTRICSLISKWISSYSSSSFAVSLNALVNGDAEMAITTMERALERGLETLKIASIVPVYVYSRKSGEGLEKLLKKGGLHADC